MKVIVAIAVVLCLATAQAALFEDENYQLLFTKFMKQYHKVYSHDELPMRFAIFKSNVDYVHSENKKGHSYTLAMNELGDLTRDEYRKNYLGYRPIRRDVYRELNTVDLSNTTDSLPTTVDWRKKNAVTAVKNQGQCGSCWAFSTTGSTEGAWALAKGHLVSLSEQQLVDCSSAYGNQGCNGGLMDNAFQYIIANKGICAESAYPYKGTTNSCQKSCSSVATLSSFHDVPTKNEDALKAAVAQQPVSVAIEADQLAFQFYSGGVFNAACGTNLDHGVLIVGYGTSSGQNYWLVKNSWGASWGLSGYIMMARGTGSGNAGECGIALDPSYPIV